MNFEQLRYIPDDADYAPLYDPENLNSLSTFTLAIPNEALLKDEYAVWRNILRESSAQRLELLTELSGQMTTGFRGLITGRLGVLNFLADVMGADEQDIKPIVAWQSQAVAMTGYSKMLRSSEVMPVIEEASTTEPTGPDMRFFFDMHPRELSKTGIHVTEEYIDAMGFEQVRPGNAVWYEGEEIFIRAARPAEPTIEVMQSYKQDTGRHLDRMALTSLSARVKMDFWLRNAVAEDEDQEKWREYGASSPPSQDGAT